MSRSAERQGARNTKLGQTTTDQIFNPITPCRVVDTRVATSPAYAGPIPVDTQRNFYFYASGATWNWSVQGGPNALANAVCPGTSLTSDGGTLGFPPSAAVATITVVNPTAAGNFIVWGGTGTFPVTSALNWTGAGQVLANTTVIPAGGRGTGVLDFTVRYNGVTGAADIVVDVIGYYTENKATPLVCAPWGNFQDLAAGQTATVGAPECGSGWTEVSTYCYSNSYATYLVTSHDGYCDYTNTSQVNAARIGAARRCCRVPGY